MDKDSPVFSCDEAASPFLKMEESVPSNPYTDAEQNGSPSLYECCWKTEELNDTCYTGDEMEIFRNMSLKKSQSLASVLDREARFSCNVYTDDEIDQGSPLNNFEDEKFRRLDNLFDNSGLQDVCRDAVGINLLDQNEKNVHGINTDPVPNGSIFSIGDIKQFDNEFCEDDEEIYPHHVVELEHKSTRHSFSKSPSLPSMGICESSPACSPIRHRSRSIENLCTVNIITEDLEGEGLHSRMPFHQYRTALSSHDASQTSDPTRERVNSEGDLREECVMFGVNKECKEVSDKENEFTAQSRDHISEDKFNDDVNSHNLNISLNDWREPEIDGINRGNIRLEETFEELHQLHSKNFNIKRIEDWIRQIDIHDSRIIQEDGESSSSVSKRKTGSHPISGISASKPYAKGGGGVEAAYNYISSLAPASTSAQMTNLGLVVIPFLSAFSSLRMINLSGNAIVKITSGALPRGLHMLNLSRNNISTIEGLRELTRLRVLDLGYNRIVRIGHGLVACSSLKELYLAGNKISEVEGLHRLLKLNVLDLQFNKISTAKSLGQLAANYGSLQAINLEGNPAQRNVGEEQLRRHVLSLLPHLVYFNRHSIRASSKKEVSDHPTLPVSSRHFDHGVRSDHKRSRRGNNLTSHKMISSSSHSRVGQALGSSNSSRLRDQHAHLPPAGSKIYHLPRIGSKLLSSLKPINPMRRSRSEGNL